MFTILLLGGYSAYKHFSGIDPLKLDPDSITKNIFGEKTPKEFLSVLSALKINPMKKDGKIVLGTESISKTSKSEGNYSFRFMLIADSHNDNENLKKSISLVRSKYSDIAFIIGLGDYTDVGIIGELKNAKSVLDSSGFRYFLIAGDHDLWDSRDKKQDPPANFKEVFGPLYQSFTYNQFKFLLLDNSDNYKGIESDQQTWIASEIEKSKTDKDSGIFAFIHEPLYHPSSDHYMGRVEKNLKPQAESLIFQLKSAGVKKVFSGDIHYFSEYEEPVTKLPMVTIGALVTERNPQLPRFGIVSVFADGSTKVEDVDLK